MKYSAIACLVLVAGLAAAMQPEAYPVKEEPKAAKPAGEKPVEKVAEPAKVDAPAKTVKSKEADAGTFGVLAARSIGPAFPSGRIVDLAVNPQNTSEYYVAVASGGVWKTVNSGVTFAPIFERYGSFSIGCLRLDPKNPAVVWVGSGENNSQRSVAFGDGVYLSRDGGKNFANMGLKESEHIGMIQVDPRNADVVYAAAQGPLWKAGGDRGLYKSTNGGVTWRPVLQISENTGVNEVHLDPRDPDVLYATAYQRRRHVWTLIDGGPESAVYKSTDAGQTWRKLTNGLPGGDKGKIGLAISPVNPDVVFAIVEAAEDGGVYRSTDRGETWTKRSGYMSTSPQYYQELICDPKNGDRVYSMDTFIHVSDDGGASFRGLGEPDKHVDNHALWIDPANTQHLIVGCDGGLYDTFDRGANWRHTSSLPIVQYYRVTVDNSKPFYYVYGGTQDNNTHGGPSRTTDRVGIANEDWFVTVGGDGFESAVDPEDPNIVYSESQDGGLVRYDRASGEEVDIKPKEKDGQKPFVFNWDTPIAVSHHKHTRLYMAGNFLLRSEDRGDSWEVISGDLTRGLDRNQLKVMDVIQKPEAIAKHASTSIFGNSTAFSESPKQDGLLYVGTDDGLVHVTEDGGKTWRKIENFPVVPEMTYVAGLTASHLDADVVFAAFENHKRGDFAPYLMRSDDRGRTWKSIAGDLPSRGMVYCVAQDHVKPELLFAGTEFGCFYTLDGGTKWVKVAGLPTIAVPDIEIQRRENDLAIATFGRGFYVLDDYTPLRELKPGMLDEAGFIFPVKTALSYVERARLGGTYGRGSAGATLYAAKNPPLGATFTYYIKDKVKTLKEKRKEAEKGPDWKYPTLDEFRAEDRQVAPEAMLTIKNAKGEVVRRMTVPRDAGMHRVTWNLRYPETDPVRFSSAEKAPWDLQDAGVLAPPGEYTVQLSTLTDGAWKEVGAAQNFKVEDLNLATLAAKGNAREAKFTFDQKVSELSRAILGANGVLGEIDQRLNLLRKAVAESPKADAAMIVRIDAAKARVTAIRDVLSGDPTYGRRGVAGPPSIFGRVLGMEGSLAYTTQPPTGTQREQYEIAAREFEKVLADLKSLATGEVAEIERVLEGAQAPWTAGRLPEWKK